MGYHEYHTFPVNVTQFYHIFDDISHVFMPIEKNPLILLVPVSFGQMTEFGMKRILE